ncbi:MAG TPA: hypothetical protein VIT67_21325 [Povalibacter sp.]
MAISVAQARLLSDRRFFVSMALAMALATLVGFAPTYYFSALNDAGPLAVSVHIHGALCTAWILLLIAQTCLIAAGRRDIHRMLGISGGAIAAAVLVSGIFVATHSHRRVHTATTADTLADPYVFMIFPLTAVGLFAAFAVMGILNRHEPEAHKRLMLLATASLITPALARIVNQAAQMGVVAVPGVVGAMVLINGFLAAIVIHDLVTRGRLHPVTLWGGGILLLSEPLRFMIGFSAPWQAFARVLMN